MVEVDEFYFEHNNYEELFKQKEEDYACQLPRISEGSNEISSFVV